MGIKKGVDVKLDEGKKVLTMIFYGFAESADAPIAVAFREDYMDAMKKIGQNLSTYSIHLDAENLEVFPKAMVDRLGDYFAAYGKFGKCEIILPKKIIIKKQIQDAIKSKGLESKFKVVTQFTNN